MVERRLVYSGQHTEKRCNGLSWQLILDSLYNR
jgi:hypothetical protein